MWCVILRAFYQKNYVITVEASKVDSKHRNNEANQCKHQGEWLTPNVIK